MHQGVLIMAVSNENGAILSLPSEEITVSERYEPKKEPCQSGGGVAEIYWQFYFLEKLSDLYH